METQAVQILGQALGRLAEGVQEEQVELLELMLTNVKDIKHVKIVLIPVHVVGVRI